MVPGPHSRSPDIVWLRLLVAVAEQGSLSAAAEQLGLAQPNASRAMRALERDLGLPLLVRSPRGSRLTVEGQVVVSWARTVVTATDELIAGSEALKGRRAGQLELAASMTIAEYLVPGWLSELHRRDHTIAVSLAVANSVEVGQRVLSGKADLGLVESPKVPAGLSRSRAGTDRLVVVVAPQHPWSRRRRSVSVAELAATPLIVREPGSGTRETLAQALREHNMAPPLQELSSNAAVRIAVIAGLAPAVLSALAVQEQVQAGVLREVTVDGLDLRRTLWLVWPRGSRPSGTAADLVRIVQLSR